MASSITMSASITVTWEPVPCMYRNGVITGYVIRYRELNNDSVSVETITRDKTSVFEITGLKPSTQYEIEVAAINSVGTGPFTNFNTTTLGNILIFALHVGHFTLYYHHHTWYYLNFCHTCHFTLFTTASGDGDTSANSDTSASYSAMIAVSAVSLLLNITLATVILIHCLLVLRRKKSKDVLHSTNDETYAEPIKQVDVSTAPNEAYGLHKITKPCEEDTTYEMVK